MLTGSRRAGGHDHKHHRGFDVEIDHVIRNNHRCHHNDHRATNDHPWCDGTTTEALPLAGATIVIDPGHHGWNADHLEEINRLVNIGNGIKPCNTTGTAAADGYTEAEFNWDVATRVVALLRERGAKGVITRPDNEGWGPCITERAAPQGISVRPMQ